MQHHNFKWCHFPHSSHAHGEISNLVHSMCRSSWPWVLLTTKEIKMHPGLLYVCLQCMSNFCNKLGENRTGPKDANSFIGFLCQNVEISHFDLLGMFCIVAFLFIHLMIWTCPSNIVLLWKYDRRISIYWPWQIISRPASRDPLVWPAYKCQHRNQRKW